MPGCCINKSTFVVFYFSDQLPVSTKYDLRSDPGVEKNYGKLLLEMVSVVPDGIVCFFVSYSYMDGIVNSWHESGILKVIIQVSDFLGILVYTFKLVDSTCLEAFFFLESFHFECVAGNYAT